MSKDKPAGGPAQARRPRRLGIVALLVALAIFMYVSILYKIIHFGA